MELHGSDEKWAVANISTKRVSSGLMAGAYGAKSSAQRVSLGISGSGLWCENHYTKGFHGRRGKWVVVQKSGHKGFP
jgi:hypothetical protein